MMVLKIASLLVLTESSIEDNGKVQTFAIYRNST